MNHSAKQGMSVGLQGLPMGRRGAPSGAPGRTQVRLGGEETPSRTTVAPGRALAQRAARPGHDSTRGA